MVVWVGGAPEEQIRRTQEQIVVEEVISTVDEELFCGRATAWTDAQRRGCGWLPKAQATAREDVPMAPRQCFFFF